MDRRPPLRASPNCPISTAAESSMRIGARARERGSRGAGHAPAGPVAPGAGQREVIDAEIAVIEHAISARRSATVAAAASRVLDASVLAGSALVSSLAAELQVRAEAGDLSNAAHLLGSLERALIETQQDLDPPSDPRRALPSAGAAVPARRRLPATTPSATQRRVGRSRRARADAVTMARLAAAVGFGAMIAWAFLPAPVGELMADAVLVLLALIGVRLASSTVDGAGGDEASQDSRGAVDPACG